jgi:hypothetical protein
MLRLTSPNVLSPAKYPLSPGVTHSLGIHYPGRGTHRRERAGV